MLDQFNLNLLNQKERLIILTQLFNDFFMYLILFIIKFINVIKNATTMFIQMVMILYAFMIKLLIFRFIIIFIE